MSIVEAARPQKCERETLLEWYLPADPEAVPEARSRAMQVCSEVGITADHCFELDVALGEALANAVLHGAPAASRKGSQSSIVMSIWRYDASLIIQVRDSGSGFNPPPPPYLMPAACSGETHGRGLPLMETLTDAMIACRGSVDEGGVSIYLIKSLV